MEYELLSLLSFALGIAAYSIKEIAAHGKSRWSENDGDFWGGMSYLRKYNGYMKMPGNNWYYRFFKIPFKERFPGSATFFVFLTDGMHLMQFFFFLFISLSFSIALELQNWRQYFLVYVGIHAVHFVIYRVLQK